MNPEPTFGGGGAGGLWTLGGGDGSVGFHAPDFHPTGTTPTLGETWAHGAGTYVFLPMPVPDGFDAQLTQFLRQYQPGGAPRFVWIANPAARIGDWRTIAVDVADRAGAWVVAQRTDFDLNGYEVTIRGGGAVSVADNGAAGWGFAFADTDFSAAAFLAPSGGNLQANAGTTSLSMQDAAAGCWRFALLVPAQVDGFTMLDCGVRYFAPNVALNAVVPIPLRTLTQRPTTPLTLHATIDPLRPRVSARSHLGLFGWDGSGSVPELDSGFATARGYGVALTPLATGTVAARLAFHFAPKDMAPVGAAVRGRLYLAPEGAFSIRVIEPDRPGDDELSRLVCGTSGLEYFGIAATGTELHFVARRPAYAPPAEAADSTLPTPPDPLNALGDTAWGYLAETYYAQPEDAPLFSALDPTTAGDGYLNFLEIPTGEPLPAADGIRAFPLAPLRGLDPKLTGVALDIEKRALAPTRRGAVTKIMNAALGPEQHARRWQASLEVADSDPETIGVTPQGLAVGVAANGHWSWVGLANSTAASASTPDLRFTQAAGDFRQALQTNNLFMVLGNPAVFNQAGSVGYQLTAHDCAILRNSPETKDWRANLEIVLSFIEHQNYPYFATRTAFASALQGECPALTDDQLTIVGRQAGLLTAVVHDWAFKLSPDAWQNPDRTGQTNAYLLFKFALGRSLADLAADTGAWTWSAAASANGAGRASGDILAVIDAARGQGGDRPDPAYAKFLEVVDDKNWTGILALSVDVPLDALPEPLQALAAGIDPAAFYAHHIGFSVTPFQLQAGPPPKLRFLQTAMFGLIDYENPVDQYFAATISFAFRVLQLKILFENSAIRSFASRVELMINRLFGSETRLLPADHGNNMILTGAYQQQTAPDGSKHDSYVFASGDDYLFLLTGGGALDSVEIVSIQLLTSKAAAPGSNDVNVVATFQMGGALRFYEAEGFDPFCWGPHRDGDLDPPAITDGRLRIGNLAIDMAFSLADPTDTRFTLKDGDLSFDIANSVARDDSLASRFPVRLKRLITTPDPALPAETATLASGDPDSLGFVSIGVPIDQSKLAAPWYGLHFAIDLGSLGALAGSAALTLELLVGWSPAAAGAPPPVYVGVKLPGADGKFGTSLPLQGILKLGFKSMEFLVDQAEPGGARSYTLRLRDFAIQLLSLTFPPGRNEIYLFGNPDQSSDATVGWYAAYTSGGDAKKQKSQAHGRAQIRAARAALRLPGSIVGGGADRG